MIWLWIGFVVFVLVMLALDLGVLHRHAEVISARKAIIWSAVCAALAVAFGGVVYALYEYRWVVGDPVTDSGSGAGQQAMLQFYTGWIIEQSLSLDNIFVIAMIFSYFRVPPAFQHRTLFWGILGALVMRGAMIAAGAALIARFEWVIYVFGALLVATAVKLLITRDDTVEPDRNPLVRLARKLYPVSPQFEGQRFFTQINGRRAVTPLFLVLLVVESTDVLFAVDSIPAIFAITQDPFLVFTSNVFAILNLRSLYFALAAVIGKFRYLKLSLVFVLAFVGVKMLLSHHYGIPTLLSLGVIAGILIAGVLASIYGNRPSDPPYSAPVAAELSQLAGNTWRHSRRIVILVVGVTVVLIGIAATMIPGIPAIVVVPVGLAILGTEFVWAKRLLGAMKRKVQDLKRSLAPGSRAIEPPGGPAAGVDASREPVRVPEPFAEPESSTP